MNDYVLTNHSHGTEVVGVFPTEDAALEARDKDIGDKHVAAGLPRDYLFDDYRHFYVVTPVTRPGPLPPSALYWNQVR